MKLRLSILLLAAALAAAPAAGQTIKSLGYNTTNGVVPTSTLSNLPLTFTNLGGIIGVNFSSGNVLIGSNTITFYGTNSGLAFSAGANASQIRNQIQLGATWLTNTNVTNFRTDIGLGATNNVTFSNITANGIVNAKNATLGTATNAATAQGIQWSTLSSEHAAIYGTYDGVAKIGLSVGTSNSLSDVASFRATGMTVASNAIVGGTLAVTGNVTMSGVGNTAPAQTADSASSLMTRALGDDRYRVFYVPLVHALTSTAANGSTWNLRPFHSSDAVFSVPPWARNVRVYLSTGFTNAPVSNNFTASITAFQLTTSNSFGIPWGTTTNAFSVTSVWSNGSNSHRFIFGMTNDIALPSGGIADAESANFWNILIQLRNDSSASLTTVPDNWLRGMAVFTD
jgi:hypothetical protein